MGCGGSWLSLVVDHGWVWWIMVGLWWIMVCFGPSCLRDRLLMGPAARRSHACCLRDRLRPRSLGGDTPRHWRLWPLVSVAFFAVVARMAASGCAGRAERWGPLQGSSGSCCWPTQHLVRSGVGEGGTPSHDWQSSRAWQWQCQWQWQPSREWQRPEAAPALVPVAAEAAPALAEAAGAAPALAGAAGAAPAAPQRPRASTQSVFGGRQHNAVSWFYLYVRTYVF